MIRINLLPYRAARKKENIRIQVNIFIGSVVILVGLIFLSYSFLNRKIGSQLYAGLIHSLSERGFHSVIGGIALPNEPSVKLHERLGFEKVAHFKEIGWKFDKWIDVGYWQLNLSLAEPMRGPDGVRRLI